MSFLNLLAFTRRRLPFLLEQWRRDGDISTFFMGRQRIYLINQPERVRDILVTHESHFSKGQGLRNAKRILGEGLLTSEGDFHRGQRKLMQPVFHRQKVLQFAPTMVASAEHYQERWRSGEELDLGREMTQLTLAIVGRTLFQTEVEKDFARVEPVVHELREIFEKALNPYYPKLEKVFPWMARRVNRNNRKLDEIIGDLIRDHRAHPRHDLLSMLLEAHGQGEAADRQVRDEALTLYLAGHETTAYALTWTLWMLSFQAEILDRIQDEIGTHSLSADSYGKLAYCEAVILESLRLYPPAWVFGRSCIRDLELPGVSLRAGDLVLLSPFILHRHPEHFPRPLDFWPERWLQTPRANLPKYCYFPFGAGSRVCIGEHFALLESILVLASILQRWRPRPVFGEITRFDASITLRPSQARIRLASL